jgi:hypothetical protein
MPGTASRLASALGAGIKQVHRGGRRIFVLFVEVTQSLDELQLGQVLCVPAPHSCTEDQPHPPVIKEGG